MTVELLRLHLLALRAQVDAMLLVLDEIEPGPSPSPDQSLGQCPHIETENVGTFGAPELRCVACRATVPPPS